MFRPAWWAAIPLPERAFLIAAVLFIVLWPLGTDLFVETEFTYVTGALSETTSAAVEASDVAFVLLVAGWGYWKVAERRRTRTLGGGWYRTLSRPALWAAGAFAAWAVVRAVPLLPSVFGFYAAGRVVQGVVLTLVAADAFRIRRVRTAALAALVVMGVFESVLGIAQAARGTDLGLRAVGEPVLSLEAAGVAKVDVIQYNSSRVNHRAVPIRKVLRAYGTFPHPNVLGAFLVAAVAASLVFTFRLGNLLLGRAQADEVRGQGSVQFRKEYQWAFAGVLVLLTSGILVTFSRAAWISAALLLIGYLIGFYRNIDRVSLFVVLSGFIFGFIAPFWANQNLQGAFVSRLVPPGTDEFILERERLRSISLDVISDNGIIGVGSGNGIINLVSRIRMGETRVPTGTGDYSDTQIFPPWRFNLPHSIPLVVTLELGIVGLISLLALISLLVYQYIVDSRLLRSSTAWFMGIVLCFSGFLLFLFVDQYFWSVQQGRILFWGFLGGVAGLSAWIRTRDVPVRPVKPTA